MYRKVIERLQTAFTNMLKQQRARNYHISWFFQFFTPNTYMVNKDALIILIFNKLRACTCSSKTYMSRTWACTTHVYVWATRTWHSKSLISKCYVLKNTTMYVFKTKFKEIWEYTGLPWQVSQCSERIASKFVSCIKMKWKNRKIILWKFFVKS